MQPPDRAATESLAGPTDTLAVAQNAASATHAGLGEKSLYHIRSTWTNQRLEDVQWSSFQGRPILVAMFYTHCGYTCPRIVHDLKGVLSELPRNERRTVGVVLVSIDPEHDTPEALKAFSEMHQLVSPQWNLLTGSDRDVRELAAALRIRYQAQPGGDFAHSNTITLLSPEGEVLARRDGLSTTDDTFVALLRGQTAAGHEPLHE